MAKQQQSDILRPKPREVRRRWGAIGYSMAGFAVIALLTGGVGYWSVTAELVGAVPASGKFRPQGKAVIIEHKTGGVIEEILVRNGDTVKAGDLLMRLRARTTEARVTLFGAQMHEMLAERARLEAERDGAGQVTPGGELSRALNESEEARRFFDSQRSLFQSRLESYRKQLSRLQSRIDNRRRQIEGVRRQIEFTRSQLTDAQSNLTREQNLKGRGLSTNTRLEEARQQVSAIQSQIAEYEIEIGRLEGEIDDAELEMAQTRETRREEAITSLRELKSRLSERREQLAVDREEIIQTEIRAPIAGDVHKMAVSAPLQVVQAAEEIMQIIPSEDALIIEARFSPIHRDLVSRDQKTKVTLSAFNQRTTPELFGEIRQISAELDEDQRTGESYYTAEIVLNPEELAQVAHLEIKSGMPADVFILTGERTPLNYLLKPLLDSFRPAMTEE